MRGRTRVLIIDDEYKTLELLGMRLRQDGFDVFTASTGEAGLKQAYESHPDVILLDVMMPGMDGLKVCKRLREMTDAVIMFVTVKSDREDVIQGLHMGADDYIVKPYHYQELLARLSACLRRRADAKLPPLRLQRGEAMLVTDPSRRLVFVNDGRSVQLTPKEFALLRYLVKNRGRVLSANAILTNVWGPEYAGERDLVKQFIYRLRTKLEPDPSKPEYIVTVRGSGYAFEEDTRPQRQPERAPGSIRPVPAVPQVLPVESTIVPENLRSEGWAAQPESEPIPSLANVKGGNGHRSSDGKVFQKVIRRAVAIVVIALLATFGTAFASSYALPNDMLYPVKTLIEDIQHVITIDEVDQAQLHLRFAARRLDEVATLVAQERFEDIPAAVVGFEFEMRYAAWELAKIAGEEHAHASSLDSLIGDNLQGQTAALNDLVSKAPGSAQPAIDNAIAILQEETAALQALLMELVPEPTPEGMALEEYTSLQEGDQGQENPEDEGGSPTFITPLQASATAFASKPTSVFDSPTKVVPTLIPPTTAISTRGALPTSEPTLPAPPTPTATPTKVLFPRP